MSWFSIWLCLFNFVFLIGFGWSLLSTQHLALGASLFALSGWYFGDLRNEFFRRWRLRIIQRYQLKKEVS